MKKVQKALHQPMGKHTAVALFQRAQPGEGNPVAFRKAVAGLMNCLAQDENRPANLQVLVALNPSLVGSAEKLQLFPKPERPMGRKPAMPSTQEDVLVQVSAMTHTDCVFALRVATSLLAPLFTCTREISGGQLHFGQDPFGFYHGESANDKDVDAIAGIREGKLSGGSWIMYQRYVQQVSDFHEMPQVERTRVVGGEPVNARVMDTHQLPASAHTRVARSAGGSRAMVRRGFPYRRDGQEGVVFMAASRQVEHFETALNHMVAKDALLAFAHAVEGGLYFAPPDGHWLHPDAGTPSLPRAAESLLVRAADDHGGQGTPIEFQDYTVAATFVEYIEALRALGLFVGSTGNHDFDPQVRTLLDSINQVLAAGDPKKQGVLDSLMTEGLAQANRYNQLARKYMTVG